MHTFIFEPEAPVFHLVISPEVQQDSLVTSEGGCVRGTVQGLLAHLDPSAPAVVRGGVF